MNRTHSVTSGLGQIVFALMLLAVVAFRPDWLFAAVMAGARAWDSTISPMLAGLLIGG